MRVNMIAARKVKNLTQAQLGALVGLSGQSICDIEKGRTKGQVDTWDKLSAVLKVKADRLRQIAS